MFFIKCLLIFLVSCSHSFKPHFDKVRGWNRNLQNEYPSLPFIQKYKYKKKQLIFVAVDHTQDPESKTHYVVKEAIYDFKPQIVIVEGLETRDGNNPSYILEYINSRPKVMDERTWAESLAMRKHISFVGGDTTPNKIKYYFSKHQIFGIKDFVSYLLFKGMLSFHHRHPELNLSLAMKRVYSLIESGYNLAPSEMVDEEEFLQWYELSVGKKFNYHQLTATDLEGNCVENALRLQKIHCEINRFKSEHLLKVILEQLENNQRVVVVYGIDYLVQLDLALQKVIDLEGTI